MASIFVSLAAVMAILLGQAAVPARDTYVYDLYNARAVRYQNPDETACTAAMTLMMLNTISIAATPTWTAGVPADAATGAPAGTFIWKPTVAYSSQEAILKWERAHMTMGLFKPGSDVHGWRNALNYYGWGSMTAGVYTDQSYKTFAQAATATVRAVAMDNMPVGVLAWFGSHAQMVTGYSVTGEDPRTGSTNFKINGVYLTDPLMEQHHWNYYVTYQQWKAGPVNIRFMPFYQKESIYRDPIDGKIGKVEWAGKFVIVGPVLPK
jgi:hypothetical protein